MKLCLIVVEVRLLWLLFVGNFSYHLQKDKYHIFQLQASHLYI